MEILLVAGAIAGLLGFRFWQGLRNHHHEWVAVHNGKRLHLVVSGSSCVLKVDGQPALEAAVDNKISPVLMTGGLRFRPSFRYAIAEDCAALGAVVRLQSKDWITHKNRGRRHFHSPEVFLSIGEEVVPLVELVGAGQDTSAVFAELEVEPVSDSRWHSVQSVLQRIRSRRGYA